MLNEMTPVRGIGTLGASSPRNHHWLDNLYYIIELLSVESTGAP
jgi:hypothetical protein